MRTNGFVLIFFLGFEPQALYLTDDHSTTELQPLRTKGLKSLIFLLGAEIEIWKPMAAHQLSELVARQTELWQIL